VYPDICVYSDLVDPPFAGQPGLVHLSRIFSPIFRSRFTSVRVPTLLVAHFAGWLQKLRELPVAFRFTIADKLAASSVALSHMGVKKVLAAAERRAAQPALAPITARSVAGPPVTATGR
jgi:hypothetical protein